MTLYNTQRSISDPKTLCVEFELEQLYAENFQQMTRKP